MSNWTLFSNHGHVLVCLSRDPEARLRDVAADVGITERAVQKIVRDLQDADMLSVTKNGRRNSYRIHHQTRMRHSLEADCTLKDLLKVINKARRVGIKSARAKQLDKHRKLKPGIGINPDSLSRRIKATPKVSITEKDAPEASSGLSSQDTSKLSEGSLEVGQDTVASSVDSAKAGKDRLKADADVSKDRKDPAKDMKDTAKVATKIDKQQGTLF